MCKCDCGNEKIILLDSLRSGKTKSCGCIQKENTRNSNLKDITGQKFGKLTVVKYVYSKNNFSYWLCKCNCDNEIVVKSNYLVQGDTKSCGCIKSFGETNLQKILLENHVDFKREYSFEDLLSKLGNKLRFDFAIFNNNKLELLIECDGNQHYDKNNPRYSETIVENDEKKNNYCKKRNIQLLRIKQEDYESITFEKIKEWCKNV